jgi:hypothetical protein
MLPETQDADPRQSDDSTWAYRPRDDGLISVSLDNNVLDFLFERRDSIRLEQEFPRAQCCLFIPREVEIEHRAIPEQRRADLKQFIRDTIESCGIRTTGHFGFATAEPQRFMPFGHGTFISKEEAARLDVFRKLFIKPKLKGSGLMHNETDISLANKAFSSVVVTVDKSPPLRFAAERGGKVVTLEPALSYAPQSLRRLVEEKFAERA